MKKLLKILGMIATGLIALLVVVFLTLKLISDDQYKQWIASAVKSATGRDFSIEKLELGLTSSLRIRAENLRLANAAWGSRPDMLSVGQIELELNLISLLGGVADVRGTVNATDLLAESNSGNISNWDLRKAQGKTEAEEEKEADDGGLPLRPLIREFRIQDLSLTFRDDTVDTVKTAGIENLLLETVQEELILDMSGAYETSTISLKGNLGHIADALEGISTRVELNGKVGDSSLDVSGRWGPLIPDLTADLNLTADIPSTSKLADIAGIKLADVGELSMNATVTAAVGRYSLSGLRSNLQGKHTTVTVEGAVENVAALTGIELSSQGNTSALAALLKKFNLELPVAVPPDLTVSARISGGIGKLVVEDIDIRSRDEGIEIHVTGEVGHALGLEDVDTKIKVKVTSLDALSKYAELEQPPLGELILSGEVSSVDKNYRLSNLQAKLAGDGIDIKVNGGIANLIAVDGIDANMQMGLGPFSESLVAQIGQLLNQQQIDIPLLLPASIKLTAALAGNLDQLSIKGVQADVLDAGVALNLSGAVANALIPEGVDAMLTLKAEKLSALSKYTQPFTEYRLPDRGVLDLSGRILSADQTYRLRDLSMALNDEEFSANIQGDVNDLLGAAGIDADLKAEVSSLSALSELAQGELPATDPVSLTGTIRSGEGKQSRKAIVAIDAVSNGAKVSLDGELADLRSLEDLTASFAVSAAALSDFNKFAQTELPERGPFNLTGRVNAAPKEYRLLDLQMDLDKQNLSGSAQIKLPEDDAARSRINAQFNIPYLDLSPLLPEPGAPVEDDQPQTATADIKISTRDMKEDEQIVEKVEQAAPASDDRLFSNEFFAVEALRQYDAEVAVAADLLQLGQAEIRDLDAKLTLQDGRLRIDPVNAVSGQGTIAALFEFDTSRTPANVLADVTIKDMVMPRFGGGFDFSLDFKGTGDSVAALMAGSNGQVLIVLRNAQLEKSALTEFGRGLLASLNPFAKKDAHTKLDCGILRVDIKNGKADFNRKLAAQLTEVTWRGGGEVNLKNEKLDIGVVPIPRSGFSLSTGSLASLVQVRGTLKKPAMQLDPKDVAKKYGKYMAALSTGGLSILAESLLDLQKANEDVCAKILAGTIFDVPKDAGAEQKPPSDVPEKIEPAAGTGRADQGTTAAPEQQSLPKQDKASKDEETKRSPLLPKNVQ